MAPSPSGPDALGGALPPQVDVYTDGGCDPNPGPGGWAAIIQWGGREWVLSGSDPDTTNNRMELHAAAAALALLEGLLGRCWVRVHTDSQYLRQGITEWIDGWVNGGWRTRNGQPVKNQSLWRVLHRLSQAHEVTWHWLQGHAGHPLNERVDRLASGALRALHGKPHALDAHRPARGGRLTVEICIKASRRGTQGPGSWGAVLRVGTHTKTLSGSEPAATVNAMVVRGAAQALRTLTKPCIVRLYSDSEYLIKGASLWVKGWQARGWLTRDGKPVANRAEWEALVQAAHPHRVTWSSARGDAAPPDLARAGELAVEAAEAAETGTER